MGVYQPNNSSRKLYEKIDNFSAGINIVDEANRLKDGEFRNLENVSLTETGSIKKRTGYKEIFNFKDASYFDYIFNPKATRHFEVSANFPNKWDQSLDNTPQLLAILNFIKPFRLLGIKEFKIKLLYTVPSFPTFTKLSLNPNDFIITDIGNENIKNSYWDPNDFTLIGLDPADDTLTSNLDLASFTIEYLPEEIAINGLLLDTNSSDNITTITSSNSNTHTITITIGNQIPPIIVDFPIDDWSTITNVKWSVDVTPINEPDLDSLEIETYEEVYSQDQSRQLLGYLIAYTYSKKLWFIYFDLTTTDYTFLEWFLIDDRKGKDKVNQYKFIPTKDNLGLPKSYTLANISKNIDYYFNPNTLDTFPYVGVDIQTYRGNIYITTGYGILEVNIEDIRNKNLFEIIPFKPTAYGYQQTYSNLLALPTRVDSKLQFTDIWNWDWVDYPKSGHVAGIISKYPPNSKYACTLRCIIDFTDEQMVSKWEYQWRWVAPQEAITTPSPGTNETMPIISDYKAYNYDLTWKPISKNETINNYIITNTTVENINQPLLQSFSFGISGSGKKNHPNFYLGNYTGSAGSATQFPITNLVTAMSNPDKFKSIDFMGELSITVATSSSISDLIALYSAKLTNWRMEITIDNKLIPGDVSQGYGANSGLWKLTSNDISWGDGGYSHSRYKYWGIKSQPLRIINSSTLLDTLKNYAPGKSTGYIKLICDLFVQQYDYGAGTPNTTFAFDFGITENNPNGLILGIGYNRTSVTDSNTLGLVLIDNIEQTLNLESLQYVKECTELTIIQDQLFLWGSKSAPHLIWYSQPFTMGYISVINTIALSRFSNEVIKTIEPFGQNYLVFTDQTIYIMSFNENGISVTIGNPNYGIQFRDSVVGVGNNIIFLSYDGIYLIRSTGMDINHTIKIMNIDTKIKGLIDVQNLKSATACSSGENYLLTLVDNDNNTKMLNYYSLRNVWVQNTTTNDFNFAQMKSSRGVVYSLTKQGVLNQWYTQLDEKLLLDNRENQTDSNEFLLKVFKMYSDGYTFKRTIYEKLTSSKPKPNIGLIEFQKASIQSIFRFISKDNFFEIYTKTDDNIWTNKNIFLGAKTDNEMYSLFTARPNDDKYIGLIYINYIPDYAFFPIEVTILTKEFSGAGDFIHNQKKWKEIQLKQIQNHFLTKSELTWYVDGTPSVYPYEWTQEIIDGDYVSIKKRQPNYLLNSGSWVAESFYVTEPNKPVPQDIINSDIYKTHINNQVEFNKRVKKGKKGYTTQIELVNRETVPFGIKSLLLVYELCKAK